MATLTLNRVWINLVETGASVSAWSSDRASARGMSGEVRTYAGGRQRSITATGIRGQFAFKLRDLDDTSISLLESWMGQTVVVRDHRGKRYFGVFYDVPQEERKTVGLADVSITLYEVTYNEGA